MAYTFEQILAADESNPQLVATNGGVTIFTPGDPNRTPLTITTVDGLPLANPVQVNSQGYGPAFMHATLDRVAWSSGTFSGYFTSYDGMKEEAVAARREAVAARAASDGSLSKVTAAQVSAEGAQAAAELAARAAAGASGGAAITNDPANPGMFFIVSGGQISPDPVNPGFFLLGA